MFFEESRGTFVVICRNELDQSDPYQQV